MATDDLSLWLKASAENKINQKNAWQATLIDHFVDINANDRVNLQKASCTLEGCMKVYSTRVDDVSDNTMKLLGTFSKEEDPKKKNNPKKRSNFIEKNLNNINLKEKDTDIFYDPLFSSILSRTDDYLLLDFLEPCDQGIVIYSVQSNNLVMVDEKIDFDVELLPICDSLKDFESAKIIQKEVNSSDQQQLNSMVNSNDIDLCNDASLHHDLDFQDNGYIPEDCCFDDAALDDSDQQNLISENKQINLFNETPFGYFKGWAGPSHWKSILKIGRKVEQIVKKGKQRVFIDFEAPIDMSLIEKKADTIMSKEAILERRRRKNFLPEDYSYETKDLYKYIIKDGYFHKQPLMSNNIEIEQENEPNNTFIDYNDYPEDQDLSIQMENSLVLEDNVKEQPTDQITLKFTRTAKRVDIKKLQENIFSLFSPDKSGLKDIYSNIQQFYTPKEAKEISPHLCLIAILHIANEKGLKLTEHRGDVVIENNRT